MEKIKIFYFFLPLFVIAENEPKCLKWCYQYEKRIKNKVCCKYEQENEQILNSDGDFNDCPQSCYHDNIVYGARQCLSDRMCRQFEKCCVDTCLDRKVYRYCKPQLFPIEDEEITIKTTVSTIVTPPVITTNEVETSTVDTGSTKHDSTKSSEKVTKFEETIGTSKPTEEGTTEGSMESSTTPENTKSSDKIVASTEETPEPIEQITTSTSNSINTLDSEITKSSIITQKPTIKSPVSGTCPKNTCAFFMRPNPYRKCEKESDCNNFYKCCKDNCRPFASYCKPAELDPEEVTMPKEIIEQWECPKDCVTNNPTHTYQKCNFHNCTANHKCCKENCFVFDGYCRLVPDEFVETITS